MTQSSQVHAPTSSSSYGLGFIGNLLSFLIFYSQKEFRRISTGLLFFFISVANVFHLLALIQEFLTIYGVIVFMNVFLQCRWLYFVQNVSRAMSTYFMVTIALDRLIRSEMPMRSKVICTRRNTFIITAVYLVVFSSFWSFFLYPTSSQNPITGTCSWAQSASFRLFLINVHMPIRAVFVCLIPVCIMLGANLRMLMNIRQSRRRVLDATVMGAVSNTNTAVPTLATADKKGRRMSALDRMLFYMMLANVSLFLLTQIPFHLYTCLQSYLPRLDGLTAALVRAMLLIWSSLYFGVAFYFYCLASPLFRQKCKKIIKKLFCCPSTSTLDIGRTITMH